MVMKLFKKGAWNLRFLKSCLVEIVLSCCMSFACGTGKKPWQIAGNL